MIDDIDQYMISNGLKVGVETELEYQENHQDMECRLIDKYYEMVEDGSVYRGEWLEGMREGRGK